jgi:acetylornithine deacetylase
VPLECVVGFRLAFPLDWPVQRAKDEVLACVDEFGAAQRRPGGHPPRVRWHGFQAPGFAIDPGEPIVAVLRAEAEGVSGAPAPVSPMLGTADARYFAERGIPAVYYGPGGGGMHAPDEWVDLASVRRVARTLARTVAAWIGRP